MGGMSLLDRLEAMNALNGGPANEAPALPAGPATPPALPAAPAVPPGHFAVHAAGPEASLQPGIHPLPAPSAAIPESVKSPGALAALLHASGDPKPIGFGGETAQRVEMPAINPPQRKPRTPKAKPEQQHSVAEAAAAARMAVGADAQPTEPAPPAARSAAAPPQLPGPVDGPTPIPVGQHIETLLVGCFPRGLDELTDFDAILAQARDMIGAPSYFADYGYKTNGRLLEVVQRIISDAKPSTLMVVDPRAPEATLCLSYLRSAAKIVVEAVR